MNPYTVSAHLRVHSSEPLEIPAWQDLALCAEVDSEIFFVEKGGSTRPAKQVCMSCEVRAECLDYAMETGQPFGIWGGMSERERRRLKARQVADGTRTAAPRRCASGKHLMTPDNIYTYPSTCAETCRACKETRQAERDRSSPITQSREATAA